MSVDMKPPVPVKFTLKDYKSDLHNDWCPGCVAPSTRIVTRAGSKPLPDSVALNDDFLRLAGYYIAEGNAHKRELTWTFGAGERDLVDDTVSLIGRLFELQATVRDRTERNHTLEVTVASSYLTEIFGAMFGEGAENKRVPEPLMTAPLRTQRPLLKGLVAAEGTWGKKNAGYRA